jgi:hypothetical protein
MPFGGREKGVNVKRKRKEDEEDRGKHQWVKWLGAKVMIFK